MNIDSFTSIFMHIYQQTITLCIPYEAFGDENG